MSDRDGYVLTEDDLLPLSIGAAVLGTGGGGNPYIGMLRARELVRKAGVLLLPGTMFMPEGDPEGASHVRIAFANADRDGIATLMGRLGGFQP